MAGFGVVDSCQARFGEAKRSWSRRLIASLVMAEETVHPLLRSNR